MKTKFTVKKLFMFCLPVLAMSPAIIFAQEFTQTIKGRVTDENSLASLPGVSLVVLGSEPLIGATTDVDGYFRLEKVPTGRISVQVSFVGYLTQTLNGLSLTTGKEMVLEIRLKEKVSELETVVIKGQAEKAKVINSMATVSARTFTIEESQRYAGARNDVSRMAMNYAGVSTAGDAVNDIVIRGNSPSGLLWRLEGVDIPNPNHYGNMGATGGPVSMLNNNVLSNSTFMTGAFPAEYGNALSGVFDLGMRNGNYEKHEFLGQIGFNGFELGAEGPLSIKNKSSYLVNYRYSTLGVFAALGISFGTGTAIPQYQDMTFKFNFPTKKSGTFSLFGLGGVNTIGFVNHMNDSADMAEDLYSFDGMDIYSDNKMGVGGLNHTYLFSNSFYTKLTLAVTGIQNTTRLDTFDLALREPNPYLRQNLVSKQVYASALLNKKFSSQHNVRAGIILKNMYYDLRDSVMQSASGEWHDILNSDGSAVLMQSYMSWQYKPSDKVVFNTGLTHVFLGLNQSTSLEPRAGLKWLLTDQHNIGLAYGLHSRMMPLFNYFIETEHGMPNQAVDFTKSHHVVMGYDYFINSALRFKTEAYYQQVFNAVVEQKATSYSMLNTGSMDYYIPDSLKNGGTGQNYGLEFTLEQFLNNGLYALATVSLFNSEYAGSDGVERPTAFDGGYVVNLLGGKEIKLSRGKENRTNETYLVVDIKATVAGGQRYIPVDVPQSIAKRTTVYQMDQAFSTQYDDYFRSDVRIAFRIDGRRASQEWAFDVMNVTNHRNPLYARFDVNTGQEVIVNQLGFFPVMQYRVTF